MIRRLEQLISPQQAGQPVGLVLRRTVGLSNTFLRRIKTWEDGILVDGQRVNTRFRLQTGQLLSIRLSDEPGPRTLVPIPGPLSIRYEDLDLLVLDKPPGLPVHPGPQPTHHTLGNYLLHYYHTQGDPSGFHPVHRLDRGTSGLMVVARHPHAQEQLTQQLHTPLFRRIYWAICHGVPQPLQGTICAPIGPDPLSIIQQRVCIQGKPACTHYQVLAQNGTYALVQLVLETGRTHQIRVHMAHLGHPLVGDFLYGQEERELLARPALHSVALSLLHPITRKTLSILQSPPSDLLTLLIPWDPHWSRRLSQLLITLL